MLPTTGRVWAAQYTEEANYHDMGALMKIVMYLWHTKDLGLRLRSMEGNLMPVNVKLRAYSDVAVGVKENGRSKIAYGFDLVGVNDKRKLKVSILAYFTKKLSYALQCSSRQLKLNIRGWSNVLRQ